MPHCGKSATASPQYTPDTHDHNRAGHCVTQVTSQANRGTPFSLFIVFKFLLPECFQLSIEFFTKRLQPTINETAIFPDNTQHNDVYNQPRPIGFICTVFTQQESGNNQHQNRCPKSSCFCKRITKIADNPLPKHLSPRTLIIKPYKSSRSANTIILTNHIQIKNVCNKRNQIEKSHGFGSHY